MSDRMAIFDRGSSSRSARPAEVYERPRRPSWPASWAPPTSLAGAGRHASSGRPGTVHRAPREDPPRGRRCAAVPGRARSQRRACPRRRLPRARTPVPCGARRGRRARGHQAERGHLLHGGAGAARARPSDSSGTGSTRCPSPPMRGSAGSSPSGCPMTRSRWTEHEEEDAMDAQVDGAARVSAALAVAPGARDGPGAVARGSAQPVPGGCPDGARRAARARSTSSPGPYYVEDGSNDPDADWVSRLRGGDRLPRQRDARQHVGRDVHAHADRQLRPRVRVRRRLQPAHRRGRGPAHQPEPDPQLRGRLRRPQEPAAQHRGRRALRRARTAAAPTC